MQSEEEKASGGNSRQQLEESEVDEEAASEIDLCCLPMVSRVQQDEGRTKATLGDRS